MCHSSTPGWPSHAWLGSDLSFIVILPLDSSVLYLQCLELLAVTSMGFGAGGSAPVFFIEFAVVYDGEGL